MGFQNAMVFFLIDSYTRFGQWFRHPPCPSRRFEHGLAVPDSGSGRYPQNEEDVKNQGDLKIKENIKNEDEL